MIEAPNRETITSRDSVRQEEWELTAWAARFMVPPAPTGAALVDGLRAVHLSVDGVVPDPVKYKNLAQ